MELFDFSEKIKNGIQAALAEKRGFLVGRNGTIEMEVLLNRHTGIQLDQRQILLLERNAGIFPTNTASIAAWIRKTLAAIQDSDLLVAGWYKPIAVDELDFLRAIGKRGPYLPLRALEPDHVVNRVMEQDADIVLIGCGGLGMVIGHELRMRGKVCIVMGGAIQVLFGIKGRRWQNHSIISTFWNDAWVWPRLEDTPAGADEVESSCYWS
jgi:hypothetical protein